MVEILEGRGFHWVKYSTFIIITGSMDFFVYYRVFWLLFPYAIIISMIDSFTFS
jgi:hypothetical protein